MTKKMETDIRLRSVRTTTYEYYWLLVGSSIWLPHVALSLYLVLIARRCRRNKANAIRALRENTQKGCNIIIVVAAAAVAKGHTLSAMRYE